MRLGTLLVSLAALVVAVSLVARPTAAAVPASLAGDDLFARASPAIAYVETSFAAGSGILVEGGYVLTDAHVVWPYDSVTVRFPDGRTIREAPVVVRDMLADLALIRVGEVPGVHPLTFGDPSRLAIGSNVYLIGYPAERQPNPSPTFSRGLLSRIREGGPLRLQFAQTDAVTAQGASGGAMLSESGEVVGIIQLRYPSTSFSLALSGTQAIGRMRAQLAGDRGELGFRMYSTISSPMVGRARVEIASRFEERAYLVRTFTARDVTVTAASSNARLLVFDPAGSRVGRSATPEQGNAEVTVKFRAQPREPYIVVATAPSGAAFDLFADHPFVSIPDPDDRRAITLGAPLFGDFDYYSDVDTYTLSLREGQTVAITAESTLADPIIAVARADATSGPVLDSAESPVERGLLGNDAVLTFTAAADRRYIIVVTDFNLLASPRPGAYRLTAHLSRPPSTAKGYGTITSGPAPGATTTAFVFGGGTDEDLLSASGCSRAALRVWASTPAGGFVAFVPGAAVSSVNAAWAEQFPFGIPAGTALLGQCPRD